MILLIDNYDSFVFNLQRYLIRLGQEVTVWRNDDARLNEELAGRFDALILSPGPKDPADAGYCKDIVRRYAQRLPILGVCLGHQTIYEALGGRVVRAAMPVHGRALPIELDSSPLFEGIGSGTQFARYHSLVADPESLPQWLKITARSPEGEVMAIEHREYPVFGVQFHPESVLSLAGYRILYNFLSLVGLQVDDVLPESDLRDETQVHASPPNIEENEVPVPVVLPRSSHSDPRA